MKKIIRLTESDLTRIIKMVIQEQPTQTYPYPNPGTPGKPTPGKPTPGKPTPGKPIPGKPIPGKPIPGKPTPGKPTPAKPTPAKPTQATTQTPTEPSFWDKLIKKAFKFPFQLNLYSKRDANKFAFQVTVTDMYFNGSGFVLNIETVNPRKLKGDIFISDCNSNYFVSRIEFEGEQDSDISLNNEFLNYFKQNLCRRSQYSDELVPQVDPGGFGSAKMNNPNKYTA